MLIKENIPVHLNFNSHLKELVHNIFRRPMIVKIFTYLPSILFGKYKECAKLIMKCRTVFEEHSEYSKQMLVTVYGGDKLETLFNLEKSQEQKGVSQRFSTILKFSKGNSLDEARAMRTLCNANHQNERIGILNLANRRQPGGVGLTPYSGSQEEYLVRRSNLAWGLDPRFKSENVHAQLRDIRLQEGYADDPFEHHIPYFGAVISQNVTFIDKAQYDQFDVISAAAPDMRTGSDECIHIQKLGKNALTAQKQVLENKIKSIFDAAISNNIENLVLGAFGCGAFQNNSQMVAEIFARVLNCAPYQGRFRNITFAITDEAKLNIFRETFNH
jgi:uncharacterized protein (TIGR02452 family)